MSSQSSMGFVTPNTMDLFNGLGLRVAATGLGSYMMLLLDLLNQDVLFAWSLELVQAPASVPFM